LRSTKFNGEQIKEKKIEIRKGREEKKNRIKMEERRESERRRSSAIERTLTGMPETREGRKDRSCSR
jgi:hypothetical protein